MHNTNPATTSPSATLQHGTKSDAANAAGALLADPRTRLLLACTSLPVVIETAMMTANGLGSDAATLAALLCVTGCLLMSLLPRLGGLAIVAVWVWRCVAPQTMAVSVLFCLLMAIMVAAYRSPWLAIAEAIAAEAATATRIWLYPWDSSIVTTVCATAAFVMVALWIGSMMGWKERLDIEQAERATLLRRLERQQLATQLHHSVANDLTTILLLARQMETEPASCARTDAKTTATTVTGTDTSVSGPADRTHLTALIEQTATESLRKVRMLIAGLDGTGLDSTGLDSTGLGNTAGSRDIREPIRSAETSHDTAAAEIIQSADRQRHGTQHEHSRDSALTTLTATEVLAIMNCYKPRLTALGLTGDMLVHGASTVECREENRAALFDIMQEIIGNMTKYAADTFCMVATLQPGFVTVSASNGRARTGNEFGLGNGVAGDEGRNGGCGGADDAGDTENTDDVENTVSPARLIQGEGISGGTGLDRCRSAAQRFDGEFTVIADDCVWSCLLKMPLV